MNNQISQPNWRSVIANMPSLRPVIPDMTQHYKDMRKGRERDLGYAYVMFQQLMEQVKSFEASLKDTEEVAAYLSSFGSKIIIQIKTISFINPYLIVFEGNIYGTNEKTRLVQHTTQLNVLFTAISIKPEENRPPRRIGFHSNYNSQG